MKKQSKSNLSYDKSRRTIVATPGSVEEKWTRALSDIRQLRSAMRQAMRAVSEGSRNDALNILETALERR